MNQRQLIQELLRRRGLLESCFDKQLSVIAGAKERGERLIACLTSRRAGKTNGTLAFICDDAQDNPNAQYAYIGLSRITAETIVWKELQRLNDAHSLNLDMQGYRLRAIFPNGATLTLYGADQPGWIKKFKGAKYRAIVVDEAGEFDIDLHDFIFRVLKPCVTDLRGPIFLIGTPGIVPSGYWWAVTRPQLEKRAKGWNVYEWHSFDNPHIADQFKEELEGLRSIYGDELDDLPWYQREWLGKWCYDDSSNVYKFNSDKNEVTSWKPQSGDKYVLAVDPGWTDATGFVVGAYNPTKHDELVYIECFKKSQMHLDEIADKIEEYQGKYPGLRILGDPGSAHFLAFMREKRHVKIEDVEKVKKQQNIQYMNNGIVAGKVKFLMPDCLPLVQEMMELKKKFRESDLREENGIKMGEWEENPKQPNDLCDCALYIHRVARSFTYQEPKPKVEFGSSEYYTQLEDKIRKQAIAKSSGQQPWWRKVQ
jgi:hypothetical protein